MPVTSPPIWPAPSGQPHLAPSHLAPSHLASPTTSSSPSPPSSDAFEQQFARFFAAAECTTQLALAAFLDIRQSSVADAKRRRTIPSDWLIKLFSKKRINPDWVRDGVSPRYLVPTDSAHIGMQTLQVTEIRPPHECSAQDLFNELVRRAT